MILFLSVFAPLQASTMARNVFTAPPDSSMPMEDVSALKELSSMEANVSNLLLTDVSVFQTLIGMELTVSATLDSKATVTHVFATESLWETTAKDAPQSQTHSSKTESANVTPDMLSSMVNVFSRLLPLSAATSEPTSMINFKSACLALKDVWPVMSAMTVLNADPTMFSMPIVASALRFVVME